MKLLSVYTASHEPLVQEWFLPGLGDEYDLQLDFCPVRGTGRFLEADWSEAVRFKARRIVETLRAHPGEIIVYSDVDVLFLRPARERIREAMVGRDIACQLDAPNGQLCTGFFAVRASDATLALWEGVERCLAREGRDQPAFNRLLRQRNDIRFGCLPLDFFGTGTFHRRHWQPGDRFYVPRNAVIFHANWTVGVENKIALLRKASRVLDGGPAAIALNNALFHARFGFRGPRSARAIAGRTANPDAWPRTRPARVALDASTVCQLKCPSCPTANGTVARGIGGGLLSLADFAQFIRENPWVTDIELSNWGEILLNRELPGILQHAHERAVTLRAANGVNLNAADDAVLEALVRFGLRRLNCSIDGACRETYSVYRRKGDYEQVIANIRRINDFKAKYASRWPELTWQFVVFGHNEHEIETARAMARRLKMRFAVKLSWEDLYTAPFSPVRDRDLVRRAAGAADRAEFERRNGKSYLAGACRQLWTQPRINFDGRLLGCSTNHWGDYGNVLGRGLATCMQGERIRYALAMLSGSAPARADIPCSTCKVYHNMMGRGAWLDIPDEFRGGARAPIPK